MNTIVEEAFRAFLCQFCQETAPMLLGFSGGPDSMALFHCLYECRYPFEAAYLDHGWRQESEEEAIYLAQYCQEKGVLFHTAKCSPFKTQNLEEAGREARLTFFQKLILERELKGVFLAHHADDQAETVLKRIFEGASFPQMRGMAPLKEMKRIKLYRPFLKIKKKEILNWLKEKEIVYFHDKTNQDFRFLRTRLRHQLIPSLSQDFGKEIASPLCKIGEAAWELTDFLDALMAPFLEQIQESEHGIWIDFNQNVPIHAYLWKMMIRKFFEIKQVTLSQSLVNTILDHLQKGSCHKSLSIGKHGVVIHRKKILIKKNLGSLCDSF